MNMFESDGDWNVAYDFDKITLRKKERTNTVGL